MKKEMMAACMAAVSLVFTGCGSNAGTVMQEDGRTQEDAKTQEKNQNTEDSDDKVDGGTQNGDVQDGGAADGDTQDGAESESERPAGKTVSILGDSISTFRGYNPDEYAVFYPEYGAVKTVEDTWWRRVLDDLDFALYQNGSSAGAVVVGDSTGMEDPLCAVNDLRTDALMGPAGACPDIILVYLGTNDLLNTIPMGTNDGTVLVEEGEVTSFSDAYSLMIDKLQAKYPPAEIYCCTLLPVGDYGTDTPYVDFVNGDELTAADYSKTITRIAENRGLYVIDLQNCGVTLDNLNEMTTDGVHPTADGMVCIAEAVKKALAGQ